MGNIGKHMGNMVHNFSRCWILCFGWSFTAVSVRKMIINHGVLENPICRCTRPYHFGWWSLMKTFLVLGKNHQSGDMFFSSLRHGGAGACNRDLFICGNPPLATAKLRCCVVGHEHRNGLCDAFGAGMCPRNPSISASQIAAAEAYTAQVDDQYSSADEVFSVESFSADLANSCAFQVSGCRSRQLVVFTGTVLCSLFPWVSSPAPMCLYKGHGQSPSKPW